MRQLSAIWHAAMAQSHLIRRCTIVCFDVKVSLKQRDVTKNVQRLSN